MNVNHQIAQKLLAGIGSGAEPEEIAALFAETLVFEIQGDEGVLPWIGRLTGRKAIVDFISNVRSMTEPVSFEVEDILTSPDRAAIVGSLSSRIKATGAITRSQFAMILTIASGKIARFQMLEDSFDVSLAARR